jgi:hypothetical protein
MEICHKELRCDDNRDATNVAVCYYSHSSLQLGYLDAKPLDIFRCANTIGIVAASVCICMTYLKHMYDISEYILRHFQSLSQITLVGIYQHI